MRIVTNVTELHVTTNLKFANEGHFGTIEKFSNLNFSEPSLKLAFQYFIISEKFQILLTGWFSRRFFVLISLQKYKSKIWGPVFSSFSRKIESDVVELCVPRSTTWLWFGKPLGTNRFIRLNNQSKSLAWFGSRYSSSLKYCYYEYSDRCKLTSTLKLQLKSFLAIQSSLKGCIFECWWNVQKVDLP